MSHTFRLATVLALVSAAPAVSAQSDPREVLGQRLLEAVQRVNSTRPCDCSKRVPTST